MKYFARFAAVSLALLCACSGNSGNSGDSQASTGGSGREPTGGASSQAGSAANSGGSLALGTGATAGSIMIEPTGAAGTPDVDNGECAQQNFMLVSQPADVLLVLDRSKSMIEHTVPPLDQTRWDAVVAGLTSVISATDATVAWGLKLFPEGEGSSCIAESVTELIPVEIAPKNAATVNGLITTTMALGNGTPTGDAIKQATAYLTRRNGSNQYLVLATDGEPSCPKDDDADAMQYALDAITAAKAAGFPTYIIGVVDPEDDDSTAKRLNEMAQAGGTARVGAPDGLEFYAAYSQDALAEALTAVTGQVASCVFPFDMPPPDPSNIAVKLNGERVEQDSSHTQGWDYTNDSHVGLELHGDACQAVKDASAGKVDIIFGCKGRPIK